MAQERFDYASILINGGCNLDCPECIGKSPQFQKLEGNLKTYPLKGLDNFLDQINRLRIGYISLSGIQADPQLYAYEAELLAYIRGRCEHPVALSLHTNGLSVVKKQAIFNQYDKATISFPSYSPETYAKVAGSTHMPDIEGIRKASQIPVKLSFMLTEHNQGELEEYVRRSQELGFRRIVVRKLFGKEDTIQIMGDLVSSGDVYGSPVYQIGDTEVTLWDYSKSTVRGLYLFPDGSIQHEFA